jgi:aminoglycoside phosphotransferase (APT) family kinase protein
MKNEKVEIALKKVFPNENFEYLSCGVKSSAFRTESEKIVRIKPIRFGTYHRESKNLNFINNNGGLGCSIPNVKAFISFPFAFSVHNDFGGKVGKDDVFSNSDLVVQDFFAKQWAESLIKLYKIGAKPNAKKTFQKLKPLLLRQIKYTFFFRNNKELLAMWKKLHQVASEKITHRKNGLAHNDMHMKNVIIDDNYNLVGLIDFGRIPFAPLEYNLRKFWQTRLCEQIMNYWNEAGYETDTMLLQYYRAEYLLSKLIKRRHRKDKDALLCELSEILMCQKVSLK